MHHYLLLFLLPTILSIHKIPSAHALSFNYFDFSNTQDLIFTGDGSSYNGVQSLTKSLGDGSAGRVTYSEEFHLWDHASKQVANFSVEFSFNISLYDQTLGGDGIAFFMSPNGSQVPNLSDGACLGLISLCGDFRPQGKPVVAVEIDTFNNTWDPDDHHIGINVNSIMSVANVSWPSSLKEGSIHRMRIEYDSGKKRLSIYLWKQDDPFAYNGSQPILSYDTDLSQILPEWVTVGFSGSTGIAHELQYILSWSFQSSEFGSKPGHHRVCLPWPRNCTVAWVGFGFALLYLAVVLCVVIWCWYRGNPIPWRKLFLLCGWTWDLISCLFSCS